MNSYKENDGKKQYYEFEGGYITYDPKNLTEKYITSEYKNVNSKVL